MVAKTQLLLAAALSLSTLSVAIGDKNVSNTDFCPFNPVTTAPREEVLQVEEQAVNSPVNETPENEAEVSEKAVSNTDSCLYYPGMSPPPEEVLQVEEQVVHSPVNETPENKAETSDKTESGVLFGQCPADKLNVPMIDVCLPSEVEEAPASQQGMSSLNDKNTTTNLLGCDTLSCSGVKSDSEKPGVNISNEEENSQTEKASSGGDTFKYVAVGGGVVALGAAVATVIYCLA